MGRRKTKFFPALLTLLFATLACNLVAPTAQPTRLPTLVPMTVIVEPTVVPQDNLPRDEAAVPRVPVEQAKAAFESGDAIIVDVRGANAYAMGHVAGALEVSLSAIQNNPTGLALDKTKWIITYCT